MCVCGGGGVGGRAEKGAGEGAVKTEIEVRRPACIKQ